MLDGDALPAQSAPRATVKALLLIEPMPRRAQDEFALRARSLTDGFDVSEPIITAQHPQNGGQLLGIQLRVFPTPPRAARPSRATPRSTPSFPPARRLESIDVLITICPMPDRRSDEFSLRAQSLTAGFDVEHAAVLGQYAAHGGQSLTITLHVCPEKPMVQPPAPEKGRWDDGWPESAEAFGLAVAEARASLSLGKAALAKLAGITYVTLLRIERGGEPSPASRDLLVQALLKAGVRRM